MAKKANLIKLNRSDFLMLFMNDVLPMNQVVTIRFTKQQGVEEVRNGMRYLLSIYPRLRSIIVPTMLSYRMLILDNDDKRLELLFNNAFHVMNNMSVDSDDFLRFRRALMNEPSLLESRLGIKFYYLPDDPRPSLIISMNHLTGDGLSQLFVVNSIIEYLNEKRSNPILLDNPSMKPALFEKNILRIPFQLIKSYVIFRRESRKNRKDKIISGSNAPADYFSTVNAYSQKFGFGIKPVLSKSKELGCSVTALVSTALAMSLFRRRPEESGDTVGIQMSFDLRPNFGEKRPVFGNYLRAATLKARRKYIDKPIEMMKDLQAQMEAAKNHIEKKEMLFSWMIEEMQKLVGRKNCVKFINALKRKKSLPITCQFTTLGNADIVNLHGEKCQICDYIPGTAHHCLFFGMGSIQGVILSFIGYPEAEYTLDEVKEIYNSIEDEIKKILELKP
jgi:NRPS condensation-like uncharacterized protein